MTNALQSTLSRAELVPAPRFLTTPSGKLNWRVALDYARWERQAVRRDFARQKRTPTAADIRDLVKLALRRRFSGEAYDRRANSYSAAADAVDAALFALDLTTGTTERAHMILAYHDGRPCLVRNGKDYFAASTLSNAVNLGCSDMAYVLNRPEQTVFAYAVSMPVNEIAQHVGLNEAGRAFLDRVKSAQSLGLFARAA